MAENHVEKIIALLQAEANTFWGTSKPPNIKKYQADSQQERGQGADQPPVIYVWSPTSTSLEPFSLDGTQFDREPTVECLAYSLDEGEAVQLQQDIIESLSAYINDNNQDTSFSTVEPSDAADYREQNVARTTEQFVMGVTVDARRLGPTGVA